MCIHWLYIWVVFAEKSAMVYQEWGKMARGASYGSDVTRNVTHRYKNRRRVWRGSWEGGVYLMQLDHDGPRLLLLLVLLHLALESLVVLESLLSPLHRHVQAREHTAVPEQKTTTTTTTTLTRLLTPLHHLHTPLHTSVPWTIRTQTV